MEFQIPARPSWTGRFSAKGAVRKWVSIAQAPSRKRAAVSKPYCRARGRMPTAEVTEYRPPTQSQKANAFAGSMPNSRTSLRLVETATMCFSTASAPSSAVSQVRTVRALSMVSTVVNVLDTTTTRVSAGSSPDSARATSIGSTFARKRRLRPAAWAADSWSVRRAVCTKRGPRKEPPMPMATTEVRGLPVAPTHAPDRTRPEKSLILSRTSHTFGTTFPSPGASMTASRGARVATCSTARSSVALMGSPRNMASILPRRPARSARAASRAWVLGVMRWRAMSRRTPSDSKKRASQRASSRRRSLRWLGRGWEGAPVERCKGGRGWSGAARAWRERGSEACCLAAPPLALSVSLSLSPPHNARLLDLVHVVDQGLPLGRVRDRRVLLAGADLIEEEGEREGRERG